MNKKIVPTLQNRYVILTGDLKSSRKLEDQAKVQEGLKNALFGINKELEKGIIAKIFAAKSIARFNELTDRKMAEY